MTTISKFSGVVLAAGLAIAHGAVPANSGSARELRVAPLKGITLSVGSKRAIGYFAANSGACDLTLHIADAYSDDVAVPTKPVRVSVAVVAGTSARVDTADGPALALSCSADATVMTLQPVERMAYAANAKSTAQ
jgi:hypothetical protein